MKAFFLTLLALSLPLVAQEIDEHAPSPEHYRTLWENSPFTRPLNAAESYVVTGVLRIDQRPVVTMLNTATGERFSLDSRPNALGWRLVELRGDANPRNVMAVVLINGEEVAVRFNDLQLAPESLLKGTDGSRQQAVANPPRGPGSSLNQRKPVTRPKKEKDKPEQKKRRKSQKPGS